jgi:hypothetical protein
LQAYEDALYDPRLIREFVDTADPQPGLPPRSVDLIMMGLQVLSQRGAIESAAATLHRAAENGAGQVASLDHFRSPGELFSGNTVAMNSLPNTVVSGFQCLTEWAGENLVLRTSLGMEGGVLRSVVNNPYRPNVTPPNIAARLGGTLAFIGVTIDYATDPNLAFGSQYVLDAAYEVGKNVLASAISAGVTASTVGSLGGPLGTVVGFVAGVAACILIDTVFQCLSFVFDPQVAVMALFPGLTIQAAARRDRDNLDRWMAHDSPQDRALQSHQALEYMAWRATYQP